MKRFLLFFLAPLTACSLLLPADGCAQQPPSAAPIDASAVLSTLKELRAKQEKAMKDIKAQVLANINAAAADNSSAGKTYEQAVIAVEFQGQDSNGAKVVEWRKKHADLLRNGNFLTAARLQLFYLSLTWQRNAGVKVHDLLPALYDYAAQVENNRDAIEPYEHILKPSLPESVFTAYYQVGPFISDVPDWEMKQFDSEGIFQKTILPELRRTKDPRVLDYWDNRLQIEAVQADRAQNGLIANRFNRIRKPTLLWNRAEDELRLGDKTRAVNDMLAVAKMYSDHPDFENWAAQLEKIVNDKEPKEAAPAP